MSQLQTKLSRVQQLTHSDRASSATRTSSQDDSDDSDNLDEGEAKLLQVGPTANVSLLDQHSKLKMEALGIGSYIHLLKYESFL